MKKAFSLIELGISLLVIGIIISAVMAGRDIVHSGDTKKVYQSYARKWSTIVDSYKGAMGEHIADGTTHAGTQTDPDGYFDGVDVSTPVVDKLKSAGIDPCRVLSNYSYDASGNCDPSTAWVDSAFDSQVKISVRLGAYIVDGKKYNFIIFKGVPDDVAGAIDRYIDGVSDGATGNCLNLVSATGNMTTIVPIAYSAGSGKTTDIGIVVEH